MPTVHSYAFSVDRRLLPIDILRIALRFYCADESGAFTTACGDGAPDGSVRIRKARC